MIHPELCGIILHNAVNSTAYSVKAVIRMSAIPLVENVKANIAKVIVGKEAQTEQLLLALVCGGHVLIEDVPGLGKTTLVTALARSLNCS